MDLRLTRKEYRSDGIFGILTDLRGNFVAHTLEHAYGDANSCWEPKVAAGTYLCVRHAPNRLPYETFELQDMPAFQGKPVEGILIHCGNFDKDSEGCILVGQAEADGAGGRMIIRSRETFQRFMFLQTPVESFRLTIEG